MKLQPQQLSENTDRKLKKKMFLDEIKEEEVQANERRQENYK